MSDSWISYWRIGRAYCKVCHRVLTFVEHDGVQEKRCPHCGAITTSAHQDDTEERR